MFKKGDRVRKLDGSTFSNGSYVATIDCTRDERAWLKETDTNIEFDNIKLAESYKPSRVSARVIGAIELLEEEISSLQTKTTALKASLDYLKGCC